MQRILTAAVLTLFSIAAAAQQFPVKGKPIYLVVTFAAGGAMDLTARSMAAVMSDSFHQVIAENRTGGGGLIGTDYVARAAPDGYTLLMFADVNVIAPAVYPKLNHDPIKDFAPITNAILGTHLIVAHPSLKANTLKELIELAKREPGKLTFGSPGTATPQHLAGELFKQQAGGLDIQHVPYRGGGQLITDLVGGQIPLGLIGLPPTLPHIKAGRLKVFAVTARKRSPSLPDVPTVEEAGLPGYETVQWLGPAAPAGTPKPAIDRLYAEFVKALRNPTVGERLKAAGLEVAPSASPEAYGEFIRAEYARWPAIVKAAGEGAKIQ
ncbi:MAG TPA: tripartite tricarboxylate transporter substrate binding protein [Burkholderiales bacterium]|nr:tripartite tricarboxylate transporter substrate binding protein [Burkholderiales bacterium]